MAKSLRSKWKRKMRAVKRVRYGKKELEKLKLIVDAGTKADVDMENITEIATVTDAAAIKEKKKDSEEGESMEVVGNRKFNKKTFKDQNGTFPVWMSQKQVKKRAQTQKKKKKGKSKKK